MSSIPQPALNGGHYTGVPFETNAPWATVPVIPDSTFLTHYNLLSAYPPMEATVQYIGHNRPGNNTMSMIGVRPPKNSAYQHLQFIYDIPSRNECSCHKCNFTKYAYL